MLRLVFLLLGYFSSQTSSNPDEIRNLPGLYFPLNFKQYSGYLNATRGKYLHYWFVESQRSPCTDPVVLWLNGGPGCSSLEGYLSENGPLHVSENGKTLYRNPYSWNRVANVIYLESPAGVGFSYADNEEYSIDDDSNSYDNYVALQNFFEKFPQFKKNDFYIIGESYGGMYVPQLSMRVVNGPAEINFKGFAIGNGLLDESNRTNSIPFFAYHHGIIGDDLWKNVTDNCCGGFGTPESCNFYTNVSKECAAPLNSVTRTALENSDLNIYNIYAKCAHSHAYDSRYSVDKRSLRKHFSFQDDSDDNADGVPCIDSSNMKKWINQPSVRKALHIPPHVQNWGLCSPAVENGYTETYTTMRPQILQLIGSGKLRGLIYNGDVDMICNFLGAEWFADNLNLQVTQGYQIWKFGNQIAGYFKSYGPLTFLTVKGSGHMVPQDKPGQAFKMIYNFLSNNTYQ